MNFILCPGSAEDQKFKRWPIFKFLELANLYITNNHNVKIVIGPQEEYLSNFFLKFEINISSTFLELKRLAQESNLIICNDSFLLHFFSILDLKVLGLYGPTDPNRTLPTNAYKILSNKKSIYRPCWGKPYYGVCDNGRCSCFDGLNALDVYKKSLNLVSRKNLAG